MGRRTSECASPRHERGGNSTKTEPFRDTKPATQRSGLWGYRRGERRRGSPQLDARALARIDASLRPAIAMESPGESADRGVRGRGPHGGEEGRGDGGGEDPGELSGGGAETPSGTPAESAAPVAPEYWTAQHLPKKDFDEAVAVSQSAAVEYGDRSPSLQALAGSATAELDELKPLYRWGEAEVLDHKGTPAIDRFIANRTELPSGAFIFPAPPVEESTQALPVAVLDDKGVLVTLANLSFFARKTEDGAVRVHPAIETRLLHVLRQAGDETQRAEAASASTGVRTRCAWTAEERWQGCAKARSPQHPSLFAKGWRIRKNGDVIVQFQCGALGFRHRKLGDGRSKCLALTHVRIAAADIPVVADFDRVDTPAAGSGGTLHVRILERCVHRANPLGREMAKCGDIPTPATWKVVAGVKGYLANRLSEAGGNACVNPSPINAHGRAFADVSPLRRLCGDLSITGGSDTGAARKAKWKARHGGDSVGAEKFIPRDRETLAVIAASRNASAHGDKKRIGNPVKLIDPLNLRATLADDKRVERLAQLVFDENTTRSTGLLMDSTKKVVYALGDVNATRRVLLFNTVGYIPTPFDGIAGLDALELVHERARAEDYAIMLSPIVNGINGLVPRDRRAGIITTDQDVALDDGICQAFNAMPFLTRRDASSSLSYESEISRRQLEFARVATGAKNIFAAAADSLPRELRELARSPDAVRLTADNGNGAMVLAVDQRLIASIASVTSSDDPSPSAVVDAAALIEEWKVNPPSTRDVVKGMVVITHCRVHKLGVLKTLRYSKRYANSLTKEAKAAAHNAAYNLIVRTFAKLRADGGAFDGPHDFEALLRYRDVLPDVLRFKWIAVHGEHRPESWRETVRVREPTATENQPESLAFEILANDKVVFKSWISKKAVARKGAVPRVGGRVPPAQVEDLGADDDMLARLDAEDDQDFEDFEDDGGDDGVRSGDTSSRNDSDSVVDLHVDANGGASFDAFPNPIFVADKDGELTVRHLLMWHLRFLPITGPTVAAMFPAAPTNTYVTVPVSSRRCGLASRLTFLTSSAPQSES